jgi:hypothetical protein
LLSPAVADLIFVRSNHIPFEPFDAPFSVVEGLGCRTLLWGERLVLDLFEYLETGPAEEIDVAGEKVSGVHTVGLTKFSRIWRLTFQRALAVRVRDESLKFFQSKIKEQAPLPSPYCFADKSAWLSELIPDTPVDPRLGELTPIHYVFALWDDFVEIIADDSPTIQEVDNDLA